MNYLALRSCLWAIGIYCFIACSSPSENTPYSPIEVRINEGTNMALALSPDKQTLVIDLQGTLWTLNVAGGQANPITDNLGGCHSPSWSPDGQYIVFHSYRDGNFHLWRCKADGTDLEQLTFGPFDDREPFWTVGGQEIYFSSDRGGTYDIWKINLQDLTPTQITDLPGNEYYPTLSDNGKILVYTKDQKKIGIKGDGEIKVSTELSIDNYVLGQSAFHPSEDYLLVQAMEGVTTFFLKIPIRSLKSFGKVEPAMVDIFPFRPAWLDDTIALSVGDGQIFKMNVNTGSFDTVPFEANIVLNRPPYKRKTYNFDHIAKRPIKGLRNPSLSPDGNSAVLTALGDLWIQHIDGKAIQLTNDPYIDIDPMFSHDGTSIAFASDRGGAMDIWVMDLETKKLKQITDDPKDLMYPSWSPDDSQIAYAANSRLNAWGAASIHVVDIQSNISKEVHKPIFVPGQAEWSPDGKHLWFVALKPNSSRFREGKNLIREIDLSTGKASFLPIPASNIISTRGKNGPIWSPDGKYIAFVLEGSLWVQEMEGMEPKGDPRRLTKGLADMPSWSGNSQEILVVQVDKLVKVGLDGSQKEFPLQIMWQPRMEDSRYVIHAGKMFDGQHGNYRENQDIWIEGNRIAAIKPHGEEVPNGYTFIDASDKVLMPGLFDMHVHQYEVSGQSVGRTWLAYGITSVREVGANPYDVLARKEAWEQGIRPGPRQFFTGGLTAGNRIYYGLANSISDSSQLNLELERALALDYDLIKTYVRMPDPWQKTVVEFAHAHGLPVSSHELYPAVAYGTDAIEHFLGTSRRGYSLKQSALMRVYGDVTTLLSASGMYITPTLALGGGITPYLAQHPAILGDPVYKKNYTPAERASFEGFVNAQMKNDLAGQIFKLEQQQDFMMRLHTAGGKITAGTDSPFLPYGWSLHAEMEIYVDAGMKPVDVLRSVTALAAKSIGVDQDLGTIAEGKLADLILVDGDPLQDIAAARKVTLTMKNGIIYERETLIGK